VFMCSSVNYLKKLTTENAKELSSLWEKNASLIVEQQVQSDEIVTWIRAQKMKRKLVQAVDSHGHGLPWHSSWTNKRTAQPSALPGDASALNPACRFALSARRGRAKGAKQGEYHRSTPALCVAWSLPSVWSWERRGIVVPSAWSVRTWVRIISFFMYLYLYFFIVIFYCDDKLKSQKLRLISCGISRECSVTLFESLRQQR
jgi:hypothetical protein